MDSEKKTEQQKIKEKTEFLNKAAEAYYKYNEEIISNFEYDRLYDELLDLEKKTGIVMAGSPTHHVGYETLSDLPRERHPQKMLSLDKTKSREDLAEWLGDKKGLLSWKLDGLTIVLTYAGGQLIKAVTRGNGETGEVITANARTFVNLPLVIPWKGETVLRGEAIIAYSDFREINEKIPELDAKYKNPRNLCSGSVRQLNSRVTAERKVRFEAFSLVTAQDADFGNSRERQMQWMNSQGFEVVGYRPVTEADIDENIRWFSENIAVSDMPSDGLVLTYDDIKYGRSLGETAKFPRDSIAFKWKDETGTTVLREIEWSASRTGLINPIAVFDPVQLEGTTVSRASVHNISIMEDLELGTGDKIDVYKANMIIPQIAENHTRSGSAAIPDKCPVCGGVTEIRDENHTRTLYCVDPDCPAKRIKSFVHFAGRSAMDIEGLSQATVGKFIARGFIKEPADFFRLGRYREEIENMDGFGRKSYENIMAAVEKARETTAARLLFSLGISGIGAANAAVIAGYCGGDWEKIQKLTGEELQAIDGVGEVMAQAFTEYFADSINREKIQAVLGEIRFRPQDRDSDLKGSVFAITGSLERFSSRDALKEAIEERGGRVSSSVSKNTTALINNDIDSASSKNKKAKEFGIPVISEVEFIDEYGV